MKRLAERPGLFLALLFFCAFVLYGNTLNKPFLCDDYPVLFRLLRYKDFSTPGFFRPLSDLTIYGCYLLAGLHSWVFNGFNLVVHVLSAFFIFKTVQALPLVNETMRPFVSLTAAVFFLVYPYHNESVVWVVGRASEMAGCLAFLSLYLALQPVRNRWNYVWPALAYFVGLASYETILPLPLIVLLWRHRPGQKWTTHFPWLLSYGIALAVNFLLRFTVAKAVTGDYGQGLFKPQVSVYLSNAAKVFGRSFLPPSDNTVLMTGLFLLLLLLLIAASVPVLRKKENRMGFWKLLAAVLVSYLLPVMFGMSTHTFEGDRVIYFGSCFLLIWLAYLLAFIPTPALRLGAATGAFFYFTAVLLYNNRCWQRAGETATNIVEGLKAQPVTTGQTGLLCVPEEYEGAFIFRNGLPEAAALNGFDFGAYKILGTMRSEEARTLPRPIQAVPLPGQLCVGQTTCLAGDSLLVVASLSCGEKKTFLRKDFARLYFWDKQKWVRIQ